MGDRSGGYRVFVERPEGRNHLENLAVDGKILLIDLQVVGWEGMDWIALAWVRERWRASVNVVLNLRIP
jgi:hypothetical protein